MQGDLNRNVDGYAFFDLDLTITDVDTFRLFLRTYYAFKLKRIHYSLYILLFGLLRKARLISLQKFKESALIGLRGMTKNEIHVLGKEIFDAHLSETIRKKAKERIHMHKNNGDRVFLISASPDIYLDAFSTHLKCDGYFCTELEFQENIFTGRITGNDCIGVEKRIKIESMILAHKLNINNVSGYTDHDADIPFLECVGKPFAITPTKSLSEIADKNNWEIIHW